MTKDIDSRLIDVTVGEAFGILKPKFSELLQEIVEKAVASSIEEKEGYGIPAIQKLLGNCSPGKAQKVKNSGVIDAAITQNGRKIIVDLKLARKLLKEHSLI